MQQVGDEAPDALLVAGAEVEAVAVAEGAGGRPVVAARLTGEAAAEGEPSPLERAEASLERASGGGAVERDDVGADRLREVEEAGVAADGERAGGERLSGLGEGLPREIVAINRGPIDPDLE